MNPCYSYEQLEQRAATLASTSESAYARVTNWIRRLAVATVLIIVVGSMPVAAAHGNLPCPVPPELKPLFELLHALTEIALLGGIGLGTLGFTIAGVLIAGPFGPDYAERGRKLAKQVFIGVTLILSASMIMAFLTSQLGGTICT